MRVVRLRGSHGTTTSANAKSCLESIDLRLAPLTKKAVSMVRPPQFGLARPNAKKMQETRSESFAPKRKTGPRRRRPVFNETRKGWKYFWLVWLFQSTLLSQEPRTLARIPRIIFGVKSHDGRAAFLAGVLLAVVNDLVREFVVAKLFDFGLKFVIEHIEGAL